jgi:hypothetical protein
MLIYSVTDKLLYIKKNGIWRKLIDETNSITSVNGQTGPVVNLTTNDISESVNLYYTDTRARSAFSAGTGINLSGAGVISALNTSALWNASQLQGRNISTNVPANNDVLSWDNATSTWLPKAVTSGGSGSVTSVGLSLPSIFTVTNSPVTSAGTLTATLADQTMRQVFASPLWFTGAPSFRALDALDIPNLDASKITSGILSTSVGGTGLNYLGGAGNMIRVKSDGSGLEYSNDYVALSSNISMGGDVSGSGNFYYINTTLASVGTAGTYTKVTTDAKGRVTYGTTLSSGDIPNLDMSKITTGILPLSMGGTGLNYAGSVGQSIRINPAGNGFEYYTPASSSLTLTGDVTGSGTGSFATTLSNSGVTAGTYTKVTVDAKGRVTAGASLTATDIPSGSTNYIQNISSGTQTASFAVSGNGSVGGTLSLPSLTTGSVLFTGASGLVSQNNANFFWDNTNNRLGLGTTTPARTLNIAGNMRLTGTAGIADRILGKENATGDIATVTLGTTLALNSNVLDANASSAIWNANQLQSITVSSTAPTSGQVLTYNGSSWVPATVTTTGTGASTTPAVVNGTNNNNIDIGSSSFIRISSPTAAFTINGFVPTTYTDGQVITLYNATSQNMTIANNGSGANASRILTLTGADIVTTGTGSVTMIYSSTDSKWIVTAYAL